jgi:hypothetical protein
VIGSDNKKDKFQLTKLRYVTVRAEEWYQEQLASVQERMRNIVKTGGTRPDTEITREKLVFQIARYV